MVGKGATNRATEQKTASEKDAGKMDGQSPRIFSLSFPSSCLSTLSERLEQASRGWDACSLQCTNFESETFSSHHLGKHLLSHPEWL